jgi:hypothetical protein
MQEIRKSAGVERRDKESWFRVERQGEAQRIDYARLEVCNDMGNIAGRCKFSILKGSWMAAVVAAAAASGQTQW